MFHKTKEGLLLTNIKLENLFFEKVAPFTSLLP